MSQIIFIPYHPGNDSIAGTLFEVYSGSELEISLSKICQQEA